MNELSLKDCAACKGEVPPFDMDQIHRKIQEIPGWTLINSQPTIRPAILQRKFLTKTYAGALKFVNALSKIAEEQGHHPDIAFGWGYIIVRCTSHASKGLTENDFIMAAKISTLAEQNYILAEEKEGPNRFLLDYSVKDAGDFTRLKAKPAPEA